ncbi:hypothetical protein [Holzapfeliella floricola]|uniref:hypothetical protein n=1 Tax=Holzapfeliella floricola TaxID=679249 RepID=UPI00078391AE|nr:hypothetical protein [Holzapfeliella floricola]
MKKQKLDDLTSNSTIEKLKDFKQQGLNGKELEDTLSYDLTSDQQDQLKNDINNIITNSGISSSSSESEVQEKYNRALADIGKKI